MKWQLQSSWFSLHFFLWAHKGRDGNFHTDGFNIKLEEFIEDRFINGLMESPYIEEVDCWLNKTIYTLLSCLVSDFPETSE